MAVLQSRDLKVVVLGAERTGKTALVRKYIYSTFSDDYNPSSEGLDTKHLSVDGQLYTLNLFPAEPSGESHLCQIGQAFILLYAINNRKSFQHIRHQHNQLKEAKGTNLLSTPVFLVGTKLDLQAERQVSLQEARQLAIELRCQKLFEISVRNQSGEIDDLFNKIVRQYRSLEQASYIPPPPVTPAPSAKAPMSSPKNDISRRGSVLGRFKFGTLKRKTSAQSLARKESSSSSTSTMSLSPAKESKENVRSTPYSQRNTQIDSNSNGYVRGCNSSTIQKKSTPLSSYRLDINTSAWRDTIKWPTEIIPEEDVRVK